MRRHLTTGIKAILAVAALSTGIHWAMRFQREAADAPGVVAAAVADPVTTGSIDERPSEAPAQSLFAPLPASADSLDQQHLARLFGDAAATKALKPSGRR